MKDIVIKYGIRAGLLMAVLSWLSYFVTQGMPYIVAQLASVAAIVIALTPMMQAMKASRAKDGGVITFWQAFFTGAITAVVAGVIMAISTLIWAFTDLSSSYTDDASIMMQPPEQAVIMFLMVLFFGSILSLLMAIVVRKQV